MIQGWHGEYDLAQGYYDCFNILDDYNTREQYLAHIISLEENNFMDESTRAMVASFTIYDVPTRFYTDINIVTEISAAGFFNPSILEIRPFKMPLKDSNGFTYFGCRLLCCLVWILLVLITMMKKVSIQQLLTW